MLSIAYKNAVGNRRAAWTSLKSVEEEEKSNGNAEQAKYAKEYKEKVEEEILMYCNGILAVLESNLIPTPSNAEAKVFYQKMKADYLRYTAEVRIDDAKSKAGHATRQPDIIEQAKYA